MYLNVLFFLFLTEHTSIKKTIKKDYIDKVRQVSVDWEPGVEGLG